MFAAANNGRLYLLKFLLDEFFYIWGTDLCWAAAQHGHLHVLEWARANDCPMDTNLTAEAASNGHLHVLEWALENGCPMDNDTRVWSSKYAREYPDSNILDWVKRNNIPISSVRADRAVRDSNELLPRHD